MAIIRDMEPHHKFMKLLCKAAGVDHLDVRRIECRAAAGEKVQFSIETFGSDIPLKHVVLEVDDNSEDTDGPGV